MRKIVISLLAAGTLLSGVTGAQAHDITQHDPSGRLCSFVSTTDPQVEGAQTGEINGGPLVIEEEETPELESGVLTCTIQVNEGTHAGADACVVAGPNTPAIVGAAGTCTYASAPADNVYLCTQVDIDGHPTLYWSSSEDPLVPGFWTTNSSAPCSLAISAETPGEEETPWREIHELELFIDTIICPVLKLVLPPDGDIAELWDCPPYGV